MNPPILIDRMQFYGTSACQLKCNFCPLSTDMELPKVHMTMDQFKTYADKAIAAGIHEFELSPIVGDPLLDKDLAEKVQYLSAKPETTLIFIFTNLIGLNTKFLDAVRDCPLFEIKISIYGDNEGDYNERTNRDLYRVFIKKFKLLARYLVSNPEFTLSEIVVRFLGFTPKLQDIQERINDSDLYRVLYQLLIFEHIDIRNIVGEGEDVNWVEDLIHVEETIHNNLPGPNKFGRTEVCEYLLKDNGTWPNGDTGICSCWFDINKKMILGNVNDSSYEELYGPGSLFETIKEEQANGLFRSLCKSCSWSTNKGQA